MTTTTEVIEQNVCKAVSALGFSKPRTHSILNGLVKNIRSNGVDWVMDRIKALRGYYVNPDGAEFPQWVKYHTRGDGLRKPSGYLGAVVGNSDVKTVVTILSTIHSCLTYDHPTHAQIVKWEKGVIDPPVSHCEGRRLDFGDETKQELERRLSDKLKDRPFYGPDSIQCTAIALGSRGMRIRKKPEYQVVDRVTAWEASFVTAPAHVWDFLIQSGYRIPGISVQASIQMFNDLRKTAPDSPSRKKTDRKGKFVKRSGRPPAPLKDYPIGHMNFLQKPGGKLRAVGNPHPLIQWAVTPLGEVLSDWVNNQPGVYVTRQEQAWKWVQARLRENVSLTSADLSSASDTLDFRPIVDGLKLSDGKSNLTKHLQYFERLCAMPYQLTSRHVRQALGSQTVCLKQGQMLGLRPSFAVLTLTNLTAARLAVEDVDGKSASGRRWPPFAIIGDDIVIETKYADAYSQRIKLLGGVLNLDKSMVSSTKAEMCSRVITATEIYRCKPRWLFEDPVDNMLTYQDTSLRIRVPKWARRMARENGRFALLECASIPPVHPDRPASLAEKELVNQVLRAGRGEGKIPKDVRSMLSAVYAGRYERHPHDVYRDIIKDQPISVKGIVRKDRHSPEEFALKQKLQEEQSPEKKLAGRRGQSWPSDYVERYDTLNSSKKVKLFKKLNPRVSLRELATLNGRFSEQFAQIAERVEQGSSKTADLSKIASRLDLLWTDEAFRQEHPNVKWPSKGSQATQVVDTHIGKIAREQSFAPISRYNWKTDEREPIAQSKSERLYEANKKATQLLHSKVDSTQRSIVRDDDEAIAIIPVAPGISDVYEFRDGETHVSHYIAAADGDHDLPSLPRISRNRASAMDVTQDTGSDDGLPTRRLPDLSDNLLRSLGIGTPSDEEDELET